MRFEEKQNYIETLKGYTGENSWFSTFSLPHRLSTHTQSRVGMGWVRKWLKRTQQALKDSGGGDLAVVVNEVRKPLNPKHRPIDKFGTVHYHLLMQGKGLGTLNKERAIQRWKEITGREVIEPKETRLTKIRVPEKVLRKPNGEVKVISWVDKPHAEIISENRKLSDCGSLVIQDATKASAGYIVWKNLKDYDSNITFKNLGTSDGLLFWGQQPQNAGISPTDN